MQPTELPEGLHEPLHILKPGWSLSWWHLLALLLFVLALYLLSRRRRRTATRPAAEPEFPAPSGMPVQGPFDRFLAELRVRHQSSSDYRVALHELAAGLREHCERSPRGRGFSYLSAREITTRLGSTALAHVFELAADLRFGRHAPSREDFETVCELSREAFRKDGW